MGGCSGSSPRLPLTPSLRSRLARARARQAGQSSSEQTDNRDGRRPAKHGPIIPGLYDLCVRPHAHRSSDGETDHIMRSIENRCGTALFSDGYANGIIGSVNTILRRLYPAEVKEQNYGTILSSLAFAGTVVGMLSFGYISDRVGRKFGMMTATLIVALFSVLSAASTGAGGSIVGTLQALSAYR